MKKRNNLHRFLAQNADIDDVLHSHAYRKVGKKTGPSLPAARRPVTSGQKSASSYRDSLVGSAMQYKEKLPAVPNDHKEKQVLGDEKMLGNRPSSALGDKGKADKASLERRHHFIEPPKRNFNRFG